MLTVASGGYFPGGLVAKTLSFQCRVPGFNLLSGNYILHAQTKEFTCCNQDLMQPNKYTLKKKKKNTSSCQANESKTRTCLLKVQNDSNYVK